MPDDIRLRPLCANGRKRQPKPPCKYCEGEPEPGWIETDNNGPIVRCPICNPETIPQRNARLNLTNWRPRAEDIP